MINVVILHLASEFLCANGRDMCKGGFKEEYVLWFSYKFVKNVIKKEAYKPPNWMLLSLA
jgi:hypothetical protein